MVVFSRKFGWACVVGSLISGLVYGQSNPSSNPQVSQDAWKVAPPIRNTDVSGNMRITSQNGLGGGSTVLLAPNGFINSFYVTDAKGKHFSATAVSPGVWIIDSNEIKGSLRQTGADSFGFQGVLSDGKSLELILLVSPNQEVEIKNIKEKTDIKVSDRSLLNVTKMDSPYEIHAIALEAVAFVVVGMGYVL